MRDTDLSDIQRLVTHDRDVVTFITLLIQTVEHYGVWITTRLFALVLAPYKHSKFESMLSVQEVRSTGAMVPDVLKSLDADDFEQIRAEFDQTTFWQRSGELCYLTSEPSSVSKETLKRVIALCDTHHIDFQIDAESCSAPGQTIRILLKRGSITPYDATAQLAGEKPRS